MSVYQEKEMRLKYRFALAIVCLSLVPYLPLAFMSRTYSPIIIVFLSVIATLFVIIPGLRKRVIFEQNCISYVRFFRISYQYADISQIEFHINELLYIKYQMKTKQGDRYEQSLGRFASDESLLHFRRVLQELVERVMQAQPDFQIPQELADFIDDNSDGWTQFQKRRHETFDALWGIRGWLLWLAVELVLGIFSYVSGIIQCFRFTMPGESSVWSNILIILPVVLNVSLIVFSSFLFILLMKKRRAFAQLYTKFLIYEIVAQIITQVIKYAYNNTYGYGIDYIVISLLASCALGIIWYLVWKMYFVRSIRVRNTLVR